jgi:hypothetical protein
MAEGCDAAQPILAQIPARNVGGDAGLMPAAVVVPLRATVPHSVRRVIGRRKKDRWCSFLGTPRGVLSEDKCALYKAGLR